MRTIDIVKDIAVDILIFILVVILAVPVVIIVLLMATWIEGDLALTESRRTKNRIKPWLSTPKFIGESIFHCITFIPCFLLEVIRDFVWDIKLLSTKKDRLR